MASNHANANFAGRQRLQPCNGELLSNSDPSSNGEPPTLVGGGYGGLPPLTWEARSDQWRLAQINGGSLRSMEARSDQWRLAQINGGSLRSMEAR
jgi:hypothetical protein